MPRAKQPVSVAGVQFDALIKSEISFEADVPQYPIETGFTISDSVIVKQTKLDMTLFLTDTPVTWRHRFGNFARSSQAIKALENVFTSRRLITVSTSEATYTNMAIQSYSVTKSLETGYAYEIPISLLQVNITSVGTTTIPDSYGKSGTSGVATGVAQTDKTEADTNTDSGKNNNKQTAALTSYRACREAIAIMKELGD